MYQPAYFVRGAEDNVYRIYKCNLELTKDCLVVDVPECKFGYGQNDGKFRKGGRFYIYFNSGDSVSHLFLHHLALNVHGLLRIEKESIAFFDGYTFYLTKESIIEGDGFEMGN
jgi:hypothetical protein